MLRLCKKKSGIRVSRGVGGVAARSPVFFFPPPTAATLGHYLEQSEERDFSETISEDGSGVMKIVLSLSRFFPTVDVSLASDRRPAIVSFGPIQELLTSSGCTGGDPKAGGRGWGVSEGVSSPPPPSLKRALHATLRREGLLSIGPPLKENKGSPPPVCFGSCLIDLSTYQ